MKRLTGLLATLTWLVTTIGLMATTGVPAVADWPQYGHDAARTGYTAEHLPAELTLRWMRPARHAPQRAWVGRSLARSRMHFDWAYGVVVSQRRCYFGSSADDKLYALDMATGEELWSRFTGGPIRLAPAVFDGRVYVASDDGCLHCFDAADGRQQWKLRAGPSDEMQVGNSRMVSRWVARGGPAIRDGIVYFAAGIWPIDGVYLYAVEAASGRVLWCNDNSGSLEIDQPHMHCFSRGGVAAQGYLAVTKDHVLVGTGRSIPAVFDRHSGRLVHFNLSRYGGKTPWGTGGGDIVATDSVFFHSGMAFDIATGLRYHPVGKRLWWKPFVRDGRKCHGEFEVGPGQRFVVTPEGIVRSEGAALFHSRLTATTYDATREADTAAATPRLPSSGTADAKRHLERIDNAPVLRDVWSLSLDRQPEALAIAGRSIIAGLDRQVVVVDIDSKKRLWSAEVDGTVRTLAISGGELLVGTDRGTLYCFSQRDDNRPARTLRPRPKSSPYADDGPMADAAEEILRKTGVRKGFCLDLDCGDGELAYQLARRSELTVVAMAKDAQQAEHARRSLDRAGVYGVRVAVIVGKLDSLPDYFANLIVSTGAMKPNGPAPPAKQIARLQRPFGGAICIGPAGQMEVRLRGELPGAGSWTHNLADAGNTMNSGDAIAKGPLGMLWYRDETQETIDRHGKNPAPLAYKGLLLREGIDSITCTDAYNGTRLWEAELPGVLADYREGTQIGAGQIGSTYCVADDVLYVRHGNRCILLDVFSGATLRTFDAPPFPDGKPGRWAYLACKDGVLYGSLMNEDYIIKCQHGDGGPHNQKPMDDHLTESSLLFAINATDGRLKWTFQPEHSIRNNAIAVGKETIYVIDRPVAEIDTILRTELTAKRRGETSAPTHPTGVLVALDAGSGSLRWRDDDNIFGTTLAVSDRHDVLLMGYNEIGFARPSDHAHGMRAYRASDGTRLWQSNKSGKRPAIVDRTIYGFPFAWDLLTGRQKTVDRPLPDRQQGSVWRIDGKGQGCGLVAGSENLLLLRSATVGYYDLTHDKGWLENYGGLRAGCFINAIAAGGLVLIPDDTRSCRCSYQNQATVALMQYGERPPDIEPRIGQKNFKYVSIAKEPVFRESLEITINHPRDDVEIRFTLDDSYPTAVSTRYTQPITITATTPIRAAVFRNGRKLAERDVVVFTRADEK